MNQSRRIWLAAAFSAAGRYSMLWLVVATAGVAFSDDRSGFVVFGALIIVEWALTNGPVKWLFTRERPDNTEIRHLIPPWLHPPRSSSFPSGHSSAAAFCAVLLWAWSPAAGVVASATAAAMAAARVVIRAHHRSDVLAGLLWGAVLAAAVLLLAGGAVMS